MEAVQSLAQEVGLQVPQEEVSPQQRAQRQAHKEQQDSLGQVLERTAQAYCEQLKHAPHAIDYLKRRGLSGSISQRYGLGYAPAGWNYLASVFPDYTSALLTESGKVGFVGGMEINPIKLGSSGFQQGVDYANEKYSLSAEATRLLDAGATILGKATCEHFCLSGGSHTSDPAPVHNPHRHGYSSGGSSSGSAALVAAGEVDMAIGCDQGGSIRIPSAFCGTYGMKPTHGLVPYTGIMPIEATIDHAGPITANVRDNALMLEISLPGAYLDAEQQAGQAAQQRAQEQAQHQPFSLT